MLWDDTRASQDVAASMGFPGMIIASTPESMRESAGGVPKMGVMEAIVDAVSLLDSTKAFRDYMLESISATYNLGLPGEYAFSMIGVNIARDNLGPFEPKKLMENEKGWLEGQISSACLRFLGHHFVMIPEEEEAKMSPLDCARLAREFMIIPNTREFLIKEQLREIENANLPGGFSLVQLKLKEIKRAVEWADEFKKKYNDETFTEVADTVRPLLAYFEGSTI